MLKKIQNNKDGMIFITAMAMIMVAMVITVTIMNLNMNRAFLAEQEAKRVQARVLAQGGYVFMFANQLESGTSQPISLTETLGSSTFTITGTRTDTALTYDPVTVDVQY